MSELVPEYAADITGSGSSEADARDDEVASPAVIRQLLYKKILASYRFRVAVAHKLGVSESEVATLTALSERPMTPGQIGEELQLTSGGVTSLLQRLARGGRITRSPHPTDRRCIVVTAQPESLESLAALYGALIADMDAYTTALSPGARAVLRGYLLRAVTCSEHRTSELITDYLDELNAPPDDHMHLWA